MEGRAIIVTLRLKFDWKARNYKKISVGDNKFDDQSTVTLVQQVDKGVAGNRRRANSQEHRFEKEVSKHHHYLSKKRESHNGKQLYFAFCRQLKRHNSAKGDKRLYNKCRKCIYSVAAYNVGKGRADACRRNAPSTAYHKAAKEGEAVAQISVTCREGKGEEKGCHKCKSRKKRRKHKLFSVSFHFCNTFCFNVWELPLL